MLKRLNQPLLHVAAAVALAFSLSAPAVAYQGYGWSGGMGKAHPDCRHLGPGYPGMREACPYREGMAREGMRDGMARDGMARDGMARMQRAPAKSLGVMVHDLADAMLDEKGLGYGIRVARVQPDSAAAAAGLKAGDTILEFDGKPVYSGDRLRWLVRKAEAGKSLEIKLIRDGAPVTLNATLKEPEPVKPRCEEPDTPRIGT